MESERKIEKLLRTYAKKRRAQAGDPLSLHPATRRMLQDEIARNVPKPDEEDESVTLWELFRQRWAMLLGFALIVFFVATMFLPALSSAKKKAQTATAMGNLKQIGVAAQMAAEENNGKLPASLDALTNQLASDKILTDPENGKRFIYVASGENYDSLTSNSVLAYSPAEKRGRAVLFADGRVEVVNSARFSEFTNRGLPELAFTEDSMHRQLAETPAEVASGNAAAAPPTVSAPPKSDGDWNKSKPADLGIAAPGTGELAANVPAAPAATFNRLVAAQRATDNSSTTQTNSIQFASAALHNLTFGLQNSFKNTILSANAAFVLANFQVQQNGSAIRVVDADGSVYEGSLQPESLAAQNAPAPSVTAAPVQAERQRTITSQDVSQAAQNYFFRVTGTNLTLKQNVVFTGSLLAISNATTNSLQAFSGSSGSNGGGGGGGLGGRQLQPVLTNQPPWSSSRIAGTAVIAGTNSIEINAVPLPP